RASAAHHHHQNGFPMYRDDSSHTPEVPHAMVGGSHPTSDALVVQGNGAPTTPLAIPAPAPFAPATQDVLRGGMSANTFFHSIRRRWLLALCMGSVVAVLAGGLLWMVFPESWTATALFVVNSEQVSIVA